MSYKLVHRKNAKGSVVESGVFNTEADDLPEWVTEALAAAEGFETKPEPRLKSWDESEKLSAMTQQIAEQPFRDGSEHEAPAEVESDEDATEDDDEVPVPPQGGPGSGRDAWVKYAESKGLAVTAEMGRDDIIEALEAAGHPVD